MPSFPSSGQEFGGYRIEQLIGRGGMSVVHLAEQLALGRKVALKLLSQELSEDEEFRQRFIRESRLAAGLEHPNIIPVHEAGEIDGILFIAMRYVEGSDLKALLRREAPLSLDQTISLISQAASALDTAHARGLVHRDVKPGNILVASGEGPEANEHIYLSDFGLTKKTDSKSRLTTTGQFVGTLDYVAPEQIQGKEVSSATDIYSLACVTLECLTGKPPFERDSEVAVMYAHLQDPPPTVSEVRDDIPIAVDEVMARAMAKDPSERYESCRAFMRALREAAGAPPSVSGERPIPVPPEAKPTVAPPQAAVDSQEITTPKITPTRKDTARRRSLPKPSRNRVVAGLVALPLLAGGAWFLTQRGEDSPEAKTPNTTETANDPRESPSGGAPNGDTGALPGRIAYLRETAPSSNRFSVVIADPPSAAPTEIAGTTGVDWRNRRPDWAPSGDFFAFALPDDVRGLDLVAIDPSAPDDPLSALKLPDDQGSVSVSPNGQLLAFSQGTGQGFDIFLWDRTSGDTTQLTNSPTAEDSPEWSKDGSRIVFEREASEGGNDIWIMDADGSNQERVTDTPNLNEKLPEFHPIDQSLIVYHQQEDSGDFGIYVHDTDEPMIEAGVKIIDTPEVNEMRPSWSPDGKFLVFDSDKGGDLDIYIIGFNGLADPPQPKDVQQITNGPMDEQSPAWGPDAV